MESLGELHDLANLGFVVLPGIERVVEMGGPVEHHVRASADREITLCRAASLLLFLTSYMSSSAAWRISPVPAGGSRKVTHPRLKVTGKARYAVAPTIRSLSCSLTSLYPGSSV